MGGCLFGRGCPSAMFSVTKHKNVVSGEQVCALLSSESSFKRERGKD